LKVETREEKEETMVENVFNKYFDYIMAGVEDIVDQHSSHSFKDWFERLNARILKPMFIRNAKSSEYDASAIVRAYHKIALQDALNTITQSEERKWVFGRQFLKEKIIGLENFVIKIYIAKIGIDIISSGGLVTSDLTGCKYTHSKARKKLIAKCDNYSI
jgi:hypothetical protein